MAAAADAKLTDKPGAWVDLALTLPIFVIYQLGVVFLDVQNGTDVVTGQLMTLAHGDRTTYLGMTVGIGAVFALVFVILGRGHAFRTSKFIQIAIEGTAYAVLMRVGAALFVQQFFLGAAVKDQGRMVGFIMSLGAGFYEELAFRVLLYGVGAKVLVWLFAKQQVGVVGDGAKSFSFRSILIMIGWSLVAAAMFSGIHYVGSLADSFTLVSFAFRFALGVLLTLIFVTRGFAAAVWTHTVYDLWILVLR